MIKEDPSFQIPMTADTNDIRNKFMSCLYHAKSHSLLKLLCNDTKLLKILKKAAIKYAPGCSSSTLPLASHILKLDNSRSAKVRMTDLSIQTNIVPTWSLLQDYNQHLRLRYQRIKSLGLSKPAPHTIVTDSIQEDDDYEYKP
jgi:hypothetical protein